MGFRADEGIPSYRANQVPLERVWMIEDVLNAGELTERGLAVQPQVSGDSREAALLAAGKRRPKL